MMILSMLFSISSLSLFFTWIALEIFTFSLVAYLCFNNSSSFFKSYLFKFYLVQSISSGLLMVIINLIVKNGVFISISGVNYSYLQAWGFLILMMKMGLPPFHSWLFEISENIDWWKFFMINSLSKLIPLSILWVIFWVKFSFLVDLFIGLSIAFSLFCLFDFSVKHFFIYSSVLHLSWILFGLQSSKFGSLFYYLVYLFGIYVLVILIDYSTPCYFSSISSGCIGFMSSLPFSLMVLAFCGVPPFSGFCSKLYIIISMVDAGFNFISFLLVLTSIMMILMYMYMMFIGLMVSKLSYKSFYKMEGVTSYCFFCLFIHLFISGIMFF